MKTRKWRDIGRFALIVGIVLLLNIIGSLKFFRLDLTTEKRFSLSDATKDLLKDFDDIILVNIYLEGDFPAGFQRLQRETRQMLDEFRAYNPNIQYRFIDPNAAETQKEREELSQQLQYKGLKPYRLQVKEKSGDRVLSIFPGAIMSLGDQEIAVPLLVDQLGVSPEAQVNNSIQNLEFALADGVKRLTAGIKPLVGFLQGHDEIGPRYLADFAKVLGENYTVELFDIHKFKSDSTGQDLSVADQQRRLNRFDALIIAQPKKAFTDLDKYLIDQFIMNGGKTMWLIDAVRANMDSLSEASQFISVPIMDNLRIADMLFKYGVRLNTNHVTDLVCAPVSDQRQQYPWIYFPLVMPQVKHPITKDLNAVKLEFAGTLDTIIAKDIKKTILLKSSPYSSTASAPHVVSLAALYNQPPEERFQQKNLSLGVLLEGEFESVFKNRITPKSGGEPLRLKDKSNKTQMIVISDGDIIKNQLNLLNPNIPRGAPLPLGFDQFTQNQFGNKDFLLNAMDYMLDPTGLIAIRSRELKIRLLDLKRIGEERLKWQLINAILPVAIVVLFGILYGFIRKRKYT